MRLTKHVLDALKHSTEYIHQVFDVDPQAAAHLLELNIGNRTIQKSSVDRYARSMAAGEWLLSGEAMTILDGVLISGQKRCLAVIKSGATIRTPIVFGVDPRTKTVIDGGEPRRPFAFSGLPPQAQQVLATAYRIAFRTQRAGVSEVEAMVASPLSDQAIRLQNAAPSHRRGVTSAPVRAAFAAGQLEWANDADHIADQYRAMSTFSFERFTPITGLLFKQLTGSNLPNAGFAAEFQRFCRSMFAIDPENSRARVIRLREEYDDASVDRYRAILRRHLGLGG